MNDEIKEILEQWKIGIETGKDKYEIKVDGIAYTWKELNLLLDYITNLQEELEDYKSRIEKAVEYLKSKEDSLFMTFSDDMLGHDELIDKKIGTTLLNILNGKER